MAHSDATDGLSSLVMQVKSVSDRVLKPLLDTGSLETVNMDHDKLMKGLTPQEGLTQFHPFGETHLPIPDSNKAKSVYETAEANRASASIRASSLNKASSETILSRETQNTQNHWILNPSFTHLVEQVSTSINAREAKVEKIKNSVLREEITASEKAAVQSTKDRNQAVSPIFQQLETLVEHWHFSEASDFLPSLNPIAKTDRSQSKFNDPRFNPSLKDPMQQLSILTGNLMKGSRQSQSTQPPTDRKSSEVIGIGARHGVGPTRRATVTTERVASNPQNASKPTAMSDLTKRSVNSDMSESHPRAKALSVKELAANGLHVKAFKQYQELIQSDSALSDLSPIATQKVADALNDYLQEQAELHGVDL